MWVICCVINGEKFSLFASMQPLTASHIAELLESLADR